MKFKGNAKSDQNLIPDGEECFLNCTHVQHKDKDGNDMKSKKGNDMWRLELTVSEGPHKDKKMWHYLVFIPEGAPGHGMPLKCIKAFGYNPEGDIDLLPEHLLNVTIKAIVKTEAQDGYDPSNSIKKFFTPDGDLATPGAADAEAGTAQEPPEDPASFDPKKLEAQAATATATKSAAPAAQGGRKPLWGGKK